MPHAALHGEFWLEHHCDHSQLTDEALHEVEHRLGGVQASGSQTPPQLGSSSSSRPGVVAAAAAAAAAAVFPTIAAAAGDA